MDAVLAIAVLSLGFVGTHLALSHPPVRSRLVARWGDGRFLGLYTLVSLAFYVALVAVWWTHRHAGAALWVWRTPVAVRVAELVTASGIALMVAALVQPSPASNTIRARDHYEVRGMAHVTRHPLFLGSALFALGHLPVNGWTGDVLFFGAHAVLGAVGTLHQDARLRATRPGYASFADRTTLWPNPLGLPRIGARAAVGLCAGLVLAVALRYAHRWF